MYYKELAGRKPDSQRDWEDDALSAHLEDKKIYE